jgi:hypothetical protein
LTDHQLGVARVAAAAFLESDWSSPAALTVPASDAIGVSRRRLTAIATDVHATYQHPPRDRPRELATFIAAQETFTKLWRRGKPPHITRYPLPSVEMAHNHWHVRDLDTVRHLSDWLALPLPQLEFMADVRSLERSVDIRLRHYDHTWVHSRRGRVRLLERPRPRMRALQRRLLREILDQIPTHDAAHGFVQHRSVGTFAAPHAGRDVVVRMDLESFFATVTAGRVFGVFRLAGYAEPVAHLMAGLTTTVTPFGVRRAARRHSGTRTWTAAGGCSTGSGIPTSRRARPAHRHSPTSSPMRWTAESLRSPSRPVRRTPGMPMTWRCRSTGRAHGGAHTGSSRRSARSRLKQASASTNARPSSRAEVSASCCAAWS